MMKKATEFVFSHGGMEEGKPLEGELPRGTKQEVFEEEEGGGGLGGGREGGRGAAGGRGGR
jgi:hypothetical protein